MQDIIFPPSSSYIYIFVRQDISLAQQIVQSNHATWEASQRFKSDHISNMVLIGVEDKRELSDVINYLMKIQVGFVPFFEPDNNQGLTAVTTEPISDSLKRLYLKSFDLWVPNEPNTKV